MFDDLPGSCFYRGHQMTAVPLIPRYARGPLAIRLKAMAVGANELFRNPRPSIYDAARYHGLTIRTRTEGNRIRVYRIL